MSNEQTHKNKDQEARPGVAAGEIVKAHFGKRVSEIDDFIPRDHPLIGQMCICVDWLTCSDIEHLIAEANKIGLAILGYSVHSAHSKGVVVNLLFGGGN